MGLGVPEPYMSLRDRVRQQSGQPTSSRFDTGMPIDAGRQVDTGGLSAAGFGTSPIAQTGYGQTTQTPGQQAQRVNIGSAPGTSFQGARLIQRISPVSALRGGTKKPIEVGGP